MQEENVKELTIQQIKDVRKKIFILEKVYFIIALLMALGTGLWICTFDSYVIKWLLGTISLLIVGCRLVKKQNRKRHSSLCREFGKNLWNKEPR